MPDSAPDFVIPKEGIAQIQVLVEYADALPGILNASKAVDVGIFATEVVRSVATAAGVPFEAAMAVFYAMENLRYLRVEFGDERVSNSIAAQLQPAARKKWEAAKAAIFTALADYEQNNPVAISIKAQKLGVLHERVYRECEIITDARPVFDAQGETVVEFIVTQSMVLTFRASGRTEKIHVAMDAPDLTDLRKACDRAIIKAKSLKAALSANPKWKVYVLRDDGGDTD